MMKFNRLLLVEDNNNLGYALSEYLKMHQYEVEWIKDGKRAKSAFVLGDFHLVLLDVMLPNIDGFEIAQQLKLLNESIPIIFVTAKNQKVDKIKGFKMGADDFITKPVDEEVLLLRIEAVLKRVYGAGNSIENDFIGENGFQFNARKNRAEYQSNSCSFTNKETEILGLFFANIGELVLKHRLLMTIWGRSDRSAQKSLDVQLVHLRKKISTLTNDNLFISNQHGKGYILQWRKENSHNLG